MKKKNWISNRFKTKEWRERHTKSQLELVRKITKSTKESIEEKYGLKVRVLNPFTWRLTDGNKTLDLYKDKWFKVDTGERGRYVSGYPDQIIKEYFEL